jgi:hypothetical protein
MIRHPLLMGVAVADGLALLLLLSAALTAIRTLSGWDPGSADHRQIALETAAEGAALQVRFAFWFFALATLLLIIAIANALPSLVPGAMCGTGVLQAADGRGGRALFFRLLGLAVLYIWRTAQELNRTHPQSPLAVLQSRLLLLALPAVFLGSFDTVRAVGSLSSHGPVSCCAVIYDQVRAVTEPGRTGGIADAAWIRGVAVAGLLLLTTAVWNAVRVRPSLPAARFLALAALAWIPVGAVALVRVLSAYHYGVLNHHCPWCLFLPEHYGAGYPLFGALAVAALEGPAAWAAAAIAGRYPSMTEAGAVRVRRSGRRIVFAVLLFFLLSVGPALLWRLRFGVWMG